MKREMIFALTHPTIHGTIIPRYLHTDPTIPVSFEGKKLDIGEAILKDDDGLPYWKMVFLKF
jgi:hypothetical protein